MNKKTIKWILQIIITAIFLYVSLQEIEINEIRATLVHAYFLPLLLIPVLLFADLWINSYRIVSLYNFFNVKTNLPGIIKIKLQGLFFSLIFPLVGDAYKIQTFRNLYGASYQKNTAVVLLDRLIYTFALAVILLPVVWFDIVDVNLVIKLAITAIFLLALFVFYFFDRPDVLVKIPRSYFNRIPLIKKIPLSYHRRKGFYMEILLNTFVAIIRHTIMALIYLSIAWSLLVKIDFPVFLFFMIVFFIMLSRVIPVSIGGIGLREFIAVEIFPTIGINPDVAFSIAILISFLMILQGMFGGVSFIWDKTRSFQKEK